MVELILGLIIIALLAYNAWGEKEHQKERKRWINSLIAKTAGEFKMLDEGKIEEEEPIREDEVALESLDDKKFEEAISKEGEEEEEGMEE